MLPHHQYLLVFDRAADREVEQRDLGTDMDAALKIYGETERAYSSRPEIDVVMVGADSLDTVRITHPSYFGTRREYFANLRHTLEARQARVKAAHARG